jgi:CelD/BcsL family acetyltransferase involved in cellulose biosynthesis/GNAT superfamily N-acetyltransferase
MNDRDMNVRIVRGTDAATLLADEAFRARWASLCADCPWATVFQSPNFACAWYQSYRSRFEPILLLADGAEGTMRGLLALAVSADQTQLGVAGLWQAEYQAWISRPEDAKEFITQALSEIRRAIPRATLRFRYLPAGAPIDWVRGAANRRFVLLCPEPRPSRLIGDGHSTRVSLAKSNNKNRLRALNKVGPVSLEHVTDARRFEELLPTLIAWYDARRLAINGEAPFQNDPLKRPFHLAILNAPGVAQLTVLNAGKRPVSMHFNLTSKSAVHICLIAHDPFYAKQSPGKLHFYYLALRLCEGGIDRIDLTPGGDAYKERFADAWDEVHELAFHPTRASRLVDGWAHRGRRIARKLLRRIDVSPARAEQLANRLKSRMNAGGALAAFRALCHWVASGRQQRIYSCAVGASTSGPSFPNVDADAIGDLLTYVADSDGPSAQEFVDDAMSRIARGQHFYSCVEDGRLLHIAWLAPRPSGQLLDEVVGGVTLPADSGLIDGIYTAAGAQGRGLMTSSLRAIVRAAQDQKVTRLFVAVDSRDAAAISEIENAGFVLEHRTIDQVRFGVRRRWAVPARDADAPRSLDPYLVKVHNA